MDTKQHEQWSQQPQQDTADKQQTAQDLQAQSDDLQAQLADIQAQQAALNTQQLFKVYDTKGGEFTVNESEARRLVAGGWFCPGLGEEGEPGFVAEELNQPTGGGEYTPDANPGASTTNAPVGMQDAPAGGQRDDNKAVKSVDIDARAAALGRRGAVKENKED